MQTPNPGNGHSLADHPPVTRRAIRPAARYRDLAERVERAVPAFRWKWQVRVWVWGGSRDYSRQIAIGRKRLSRPAAARAIATLEKLIRDLQALIAELRVVADRPSGAFPSRKKIALTIRPPE